MKPNQTIRIEVRFSTQEELDKAKEELFLSEAQEVEVYDGTIEASVLPEVVKTLKDLGYLIDFSHEQAVRFDGDNDLGPSLMNLKNAAPETKESRVLSLADRIRNRSKGLDIDPHSFHCRVVDKARDYVVPLLDGIFGLDEAKNLDLIQDQSYLLEEDAYIIELNGPMKNEWRERLFELEVSLRAYYRAGSTYTYSAILTRDQLNALQAEPFVGAVMRYGLAQTLSVDLAQFLNKSLKSGAKTDAAVEAEVEEEMQTFDASLHDESLISRVRTFIESSRQARDIIAGGRNIRFKTKPNGSLLIALAQLPQVASVSFYEPPKLSCDVARDMVGLCFPAGQTDYLGDSEIVALFDSGIDSTHPDLIDRIADAIQYGSGTVEDLCGHGTHVVGTICGTGAASNGEVCGMAPKAKIISIGIVDQGGELDLPVDLGDLMQMAVDRGAKIINLSWGHSMKGDYHHGSFNMDRFTYDHPEVLIVVAAGNDGQAQQGMHQYRTVGVPGTAKNVLTVGATASRRTAPVFPEKWGMRFAAKFPVSPQRDEPLVFMEEPGKVYGGPAAVSSRGPTDFDSIKPELIAPGTYILSAKAINSRETPKETYAANDHYTFKTGTSMATPVVSGLAAVVREFLRVEHQYPNPSSSLIKAILIACSSPIHNLREDQQDISLQQVGFPDFDQGFGLVNAHRLLNKADNFCFVDVSNDSDEALVSKAPLGGLRKSSRLYEFELMDVGDLNAVLTWLDPPAKGVQNNLQLSLGTPAFKWELGNMGHVYKKSRFFDSTPGSLNVYPLDKYNTVEKISLKDAPVGRYRLKVMAQSTVSLPQGYSICVIGKNVINFKNKIY